jgi:hypothetical protein
MGTIENFISSQLMRMDAIEKLISSQSKRMDKIEDLLNETKNCPNENCPNKELLEFGSLMRRTDDFVYSESTVASPSLSTPQRQEGEHDISPIIIPSSSKSREVTPAPYEVRSCKSTGGIKVEPIQNSGVEWNTLLDTMASTDDWWNILMK